MSFKLHGARQTNRLARSLVLIAGSILLISSSVRAENAAANAPSAGSACSAPEYRQLDFWIGDWDVFEAGNKHPVARIRVDRILDGCVLQEHYQDTEGKQGQSFSIYDASRKCWHQTWVTSNGQLLVIEGGLKGGDIVLTGETREADGRTKRVRGVWKRDGSTGVRETAVTSLDGGKTWQQWFDLFFRPHTGS